MGLLDDTIAQLREVLARVEDIDLWPPWDAARTIVEAVARAVEVLTRPPDPAPDDVSDAATAWRRIASSVDRGCDELTICHARVDATVWAGTSGHAFRVSMRRLGTRTATVSPAARDVANALDALAPELTSARDRHRRAEDQLRDHLQLSWGELLPWEVAEHLGGVVADVIHAMREAIGAYADAADAVRVATIAIRTAMDEIDLPDKLPAGVSPVSLVNTWEDAFDTLHGTYTQPDDTTCGSASLVMSRMLNDPAYASWMATGIDPTTGLADARTPQERFSAESLAMHERTNSAFDRVGDWQAPWPAGLGTAPWAVAHEMSSSGGSGVPGTHYEVQTVAPSDRGDTYDRIATSVAAAHTVPLYVGDATHPGHVVLVTGSRRDFLTVFDPASGQEQTISRHDFTDGSLGVSGWDEPWFAVVPSR